MDSLRYIGLDLHRDTISAAVLDSDGTLMLQSVLATRAARLLIFSVGSGARCMSPSKSAATRHGSTIF